ncbi:MAG: hypothetical protein ACTSUV_04100, partial [Candidatus Ranarchaeia archaeon]
FLNYETKWLSRSDIVDVTYETGIKLNKLKMKHELIDEATLSSILKKLELGQIVTKKIRKIQKSNDKIKNSKVMENMKDEINQLSLELLNKKQELYPEVKTGIKIFGSGLLWIKRLLSS